MAEYRLTTTESNDAVIYSLEAVTNLRVGTAISLDIGEAFDRAIGWLMTRVIQDGRGERSCTLARFTDSTRPDRRLVVKVTARCDTSGSPR